MAIKGEQFAGTLAVAGFVTERGKRQRAFDDDADFAAMPGFRLADRCRHGIQVGLAEGAPDQPAGGGQVFQFAQQAHFTISPRRRRHQNCRHRRKIRHHHCVRHRLNASRHRRRRSAGRRRRR